MTALKEKMHVSERTQIRGTYKEDAPLGSVGWFRTGGTADLLVKPADEEDLAHFLSACPGDVPITVVGALSNTIVRDGGVRGIVIRLGRGFSNISCDGDVVTSGSLALDANVSKVAAENGVAGLEFFSGIPGSIGGAVKMNAGCYGTETKDVLIEATAYDRAGKMQKLTSENLEMRYRHTALPQDMIVTGAKFQGQSGISEKIFQNINEIKEKRENSQPIKEKTGGSTFANPSLEDLENAGFSPETKVWQLIDQVGGRGLMQGGAQMSEKHCNFMINTDNATATDLENLGEEIRRRVYDHFGIQLRWEIRRIGEKTENA